MTITEQPCDPYLYHCPLVDQHRPRMCHSMLPVHWNKLGDTRLESGGPQRAEATAAPAPTDSAKCHHENKGKWKSCFALWFLNWCGGLSAERTQRTHCTLIHRATKSIHSLHITGLEFVEISCKCFSVSEWVSEWQTKATYMGIIQSKFTTSTICMEIFKSQCHLWQMPHCIKWRIVDALFLVWNKVQWFLTMRRHVCSDELTEGSVGLKRIVRCV